MPCHTFCTPAQSVENFLQYQKAVPLANSTFTRTVIATITIKRISQILLLFVVFLQPLFCQKSEVGFSMGYGKYLLEDYSRPFVHPFSEYGAHSFDIGLGYYYTPKEAAFSISPGLHYSIKGDNDLRLQYFRLPVGLDVSIGNKLIKFRLSFGTYLSALIADSGISPDSDFHKTPARRFRHRLPSK